MVAQHNKDLFPWTKVGVWITNNGIYAKSDCEIRSHRYFKYAWTFDVKICTKVLALK